MMERPTNGILLRADDSSVPVVLVPTEDPEVFRIVGRDGDTVPLEPGDALHAELRGGAYTAEVVAAPPAAVSEVARWPGVKAGIVVLAGGRRADA